VLPFLKFIYPNIDSNIADIATFKRYEQKYGSSNMTVGEDEARDNFFKD